MFATLVPARVTDLMENQIFVAQSVITIFRVFKAWVCLSCNVGMIIGVFSSPKVEAIIIIIVCILFGTLDIGSGPYTDVSCLIAFDARTIEQALLHNKRTTILCGTEKAGVV